MNDSSLFRTVCFPTNELGFNSQSRAVDRSRGAQEIPVRRVHIRSIDPTSGENFFQLTHHRFNLIFSCWPP
jgi:hypothetical protein